MAKAQAVSGSDRLRPITRAQSAGVERCKMNRFSVGSPPWTRTLTFEARDPDPSIPRDHFRLPHQRRRSRPLLPADAAETLRQAVEVDVDDRRQVERQEL